MKSKQWNLLPKSESGSIEGAFRTERVPMVAALAPRLRAADPSERRHAVTLAERATREERLVAWWESSLFREVQDREEERQAKLGRKLAEFARRGVVGHVGDGWREGMTVATGAALLGKLVGIEQWGTWAKGAYGLVVVGAVGGVALASGRGRAGAETQRIDEEICASKALVERKRRELGFRLVGGGELLER